jgi:putative hemolysin
MSSVLFEIVLIFVLLLANGVFAMTEIAIVSSRRGKLQAMAEGGNKGAAKALELADTPERFLSTVQIGITLIGILASIFGGARIADKLAATMEGIPWLGQFADNTAFVIVIGALTYFSLVIGELVPKRLAMQYPESIASAMARPMAFISRITAIFVYFLSGSTTFILKMLGLGSAAAEGMSKDEFRVLIREGVIAGTIEQGESTMMEGVLTFEKLDVYDIMIPRPKVVWIDVDSKHEDTWPVIVRSSQSFFPVYQKDRDNLVGVISIKDCYAQLAAGVPISFRHLMRPPLLVPEVQKASATLETFRKTGDHVAFVVDEFGGVIGMVTLIDLMESIVGDVPSVEERRTLAIQQRADGSWLIDGLFEIEKLGRHLTGFTHPVEAGDEYQTVAGFFGAKLARVPVEGDIIRDSGWIFEIVDMDGIRVDKVIASVDPEAEKEKELENVEEITVARS